MRQICKPRHPLSCGAAALFFCFSLLGCYGAAAAAGDGGMRTVSVNDTALNMNAFTISIPADWKFVGLILRPHGCYGPSVPADGLSYSAVAPDGINAAMKLPGAAWSWSSDGTSPQGPKCAPISIDSAAGFLLNIAVPHIHPTAQILGIDPLTPQMQQNLEAQRRQLAANSFGPMQMIQTLDIARVRIEYVFDGRLVQEELGTAVSCIGSNQPAFPALHRPARTVRTCMAHGIFATRAPKGELDQLLARKLPPPQVNQQWDQEISQRIKTAAEQYRIASDKQFQAIQDHYKQVTANMLANGQRFNDNLAQSTQHAMAADRAQQAAIDHAAHLQVLDSLNRQDFVDPRTGQKIETSNQYMHNWVSSDGSSVVLNNDPTFNPNGVVDPIREGWTELIPIE